MHRRHIVLAGIVSFLLAVLLWQLTPEQRVARYISAHREDLEARADAYFAGEASFSYPGDLFAANTWPGEHSMAEYILFSHGATWYGCYYSPDDVPLAFQNAAVPLTQTADGWAWGGKSNYLGETSRLAPNWYFFQVSRR